jgi:biopolymer transport protein ExbD
MTPMIDMSFLLITFFVMTLRLSMSAAEQQVELPHADQAQTRHEAQLELVTLVIDRGGRILWSDREVSLDEIEPALRRRAAAGRTLKVALRADARSPFRRVRAVMRAAAEAGVETMSIAALKAGEAPS